MTPGESGSPEEGPCHSMASGSSDDSPSLSPKGPSGMYSSNCTLGENE